MNKALEDEIVQLWLFVEEPVTFPNGDLTHDEVRDMLRLVRQIKTRLEVLDAKMETDLG